MSTIKLTEHDLDSVFRTAIECSYNHTVITDIDGIILFANKAAEKTTGYSFQEMRGNTPRMWGHQMKLDFYEKLWNTIKQNKKSFKGEIINKRKNGQIYTALATISPIFHTDGNITGFIGIEEDITGIKETEQHLLEKSKILDQTLQNLKDQNASLEDGRRAILNILEDEKALEVELKAAKEGVEKTVEERTNELAEEKARLMAAIGSLPQAFMIINTNNEIVLYNNRLTPVLGKGDGVWTLSKVNNSLGEQIDLEKEVSQAIQFKKTLYGKEILSGSKYLKIFIAPVLPGILSETNEVIGVVITISDITEERLLTRSKDEFFSIASHELRTPLTIIRGNTSMMLDHYAKQLEDPDLKAMVLDTHEASIHLIAIVNDFLNVSRLEQGKMEYYLEKFYPSVVVEEVLSELQMSAKEKGIHLVNAINKTACVWADKGKMGQIILNLVSNSLKFTKKGSITLSSVILENATQIHISDTGVGIPLANQNLLFHKFQQAGSSIVTRDNPQGTGLGLYISRLLAEGMGGKLELVKSIEGQGTEFCLTLPIQNNDIK